MLGPSGVHVLFRTNRAIATQIFYRKQGAQEWQAGAVDAGGLEHDLMVSGLSAATGYQYKLRFSNGQEWEDDRAKFQTAPEPGKRKKFGFWSLGDMYPGETQAKVMEGFKSFIGNKPIDFITTQGDNIYCGNYDDCFKNSFFGVYEDFLMQYPSFPSAGNHDYSNNPWLSPKDVAYLRRFHLPNRAELGGVSSGSEAYYSYDYANAHFVVLESFAFDSTAKRVFDPNSAQYQWLEADLKANKKEWTIVYFHFPPYTKGTYDSDVVPDLIQHRTQLVPLFEKYQVDLVLSGHSHVYERSRPTLGHYESSTNFLTSKHQVQSGSGRFDGADRSCPYRMDDKRYTGPVYIVNGTGGGTGNYKGRHPIMETMLGIPGSTYIEVDGPILQGKFIDANGQVLDKYTLIKTSDGRCEQCFNNLNPKGCGPSKEPMFSSKQALSNAQNLAFCQQVGEVKLLASGDSSAKFRWYEAGKLLGEQMEWKLDANQIGKRVLELSQVVAGLESAKTNIALEVYPQPAAPRGIIGPDSVYVGRTYRFQVQNPENVTYQWTWPSAWSAKVDGNALELVPSLLDGMIQVRQISSQTCPSPSADKLLKALLVLEAPTPQSEFKAYPNPSTGAWIQVSIPSSHQGGQLELWDLQGKRRWQSQHAQGQQGYALGALANGTYLLRLQKAGQPSLEQKLWIQN